MGRCCPRSELERDAQQGTAGSGKLLKLPTDIRQSLQPERGVLFLGCAAFMSRASSLLRHLFSLWAGSSCDRLRARDTSGAVSAARISLEPGPYFPSYAASPLAAAMSGESRAQNGPMLSAPHHTLLHANQPSPLPTATTSSPALPAGKAPTPSALAARRSKPMSHQQPSAGRTTVNFTPQEFARLKVRSERLEGDNALLRSALEGLAERNKELETRVQVR